MQTVRDINTCGGCLGSVKSDAFLQYGLLFCDQTCFDRFQHGFERYPYKNRYFNLPCAQCKCGFTVRAHTLYDSARGDYFCRQVCLDGRRRDIDLRNAPPIVVAVEASSEVTPRELCESPASAMHLVIRLHK